MQKLASIQPRTSPAKFVPSSGAAAQLDAIKVTFRGYESPDARGDDLDDAANEIADFEELLKGTDQDFRISGDFD